MSIDGFHKNDELIDLADGFKKKRDSTPVGGIDLGLS